jgi:hypothetical protein
MIHLILFALLQSTPHAPLTNAKVRIHNPAFLREARDSAFRNCLVSEDGKSAFIYDGKISRFDLASERSYPAEDLFFFSKGGRLMSATTSQGAHMEPAGTAQRRTGDLAILYAPNAHELLLAGTVGDKTRLTAVRYEKRGVKPNLDVEIEPGRRDPAAAVGAAMPGGVETWYLLESHGSYPGAVSAVDSRRRKAIGKCGGGGPFSQFEPSSRRLIGNSGDAVLATAVGSTKTYCAALPSEAGWGFLSRGTLYFTDAKRTWKRVGGKWESIGDFRVLGKSACGKYWAILDGAGKAWLVDY